MGNRNAMMGRPYHLRQGAQRIQFVGEDVYIGGHLFPRKDNPQVQQKVEVEEVLLRPLEYPGVDLEGDQPSEDPGVDLEEEDGPLQDPFGTQQDGFVEEIGNESEVKDKAMEEEKEVEMEEKAERKMEGNEEKEAETGKCAMEVDQGIRQLNQDILLSESSNDDGDGFLLDNRLIIILIYKIQNKIFKLKCKRRQSQNCKRPALPENV